MQKFSQEGKGLARTEIDKNIKTARKKFSDM